MGPAAFGALPRAEPGARWHHRHFPRAASGAGAPAPSRRLSAAAGGPSPTAAQPPPCPGGGLRGAGGRAGRRGRRSPPRGAAPLGAGRGAGERGAAPSDEPGRWEAARRGGVTAAAALIRAGAGGGRRVLSGGAPRPLAEHALPARAGAGAQLAAGRPGAAAALAVPAGAVPLRQARGAAVPAAGPAAGSLRLVRAGAALLPGARAAAGAAQPAPPRAAGLPPPLLPLLLALLLQVPRGEGRPGGRCWRVPQEFVRLPPRVTSVLCPLLLLPLPSCHFPRGLVRSLHAAFRRVIKPTFRKRRGQAKAECHSLAKGDVTSEVKPSRFLYPNS